MSHTIRGDDPRNCIDDAWYNFPLLTEICGKICRHADIRWSRSCGVKLNIILRAYKNRKIIADTIRNHNVWFAVAIKVTNHWYEWNCSCLEIHSIGKRYTANIACVSEHRN